MSLIKFLLFGVLMILAGAALGAIVTGRAYLIFRYLGI
jgi:hypothetical protein